MSAKGKSPAWDSERTKKLIKEYEAQDILWNPSNRGYLHRNARVDAWAVMANNMELNVSEVKRKMNSLIAVFKTQHRKGVAHPRWWYNHMTFLLNINTTGDDGQPKMANTAQKYENSQNSDGSICNDDQDANEIEFIAEDPKKRPYQSAFQEFRAEFEPPKRLHIMGESDSSMVPPLHESDTEVLSETESNPQPDTSSSIDDSDDLYVKYLDSKLKTYNALTRNAIVFHFNRILYEADMGLLEMPEIVTSSK